MALSPVPDISRIPESELVTEAAIAPLEAYIAYQSAHAGVYNAKAGRSLLRLYQLFPSKLNNVAAIQILTKAVLYAPETDFQLALYITPHALRDTESVSTLSKLDAALQTGRYEDFWALVKSPSSHAVVAAVSGFDEIARETIVKCLNRLYSKIDVSALSSKLDLTDAPAFVAKHGWTMEGTVALPPAIPDNTPRVKKGGDEGFKYSDVAGLVQTLSR